MNFAVRVLEHEMTHYGAMKADKDGRVRGATIDEVNVNGQNVERGAIYETQAYGSVGNHTTNAGFAFFRYYSFVQLKGGSAELRDQLRQRANDFKMKKVN